MRMDTQRQAVDEFQQIRRLQRVANFVLRGVVQRTIADVDGNRIVEQDDILADQRKLLAQVAQGKRLNIATIDEDLAGIRLHESWQHVDQRGLAAAGSSDQRDRLARLDGDTDILQCVRPGLGVSVEHVAILDPPLGPALECFRASLDLRNLVDQDEDTFGRHQHLLHPAGNLGQSFDRIENLRERGHERREAADRQRAGVGLAEGNGDHGGDCHRSHHLRDRGERGIRRRSPHIETPQAPADIAEAFALELIPVEQLDHALAIDALADDPGQLGVHVDGVAVDAAQPIDEGA